MRPRTLWRLVRLLATFAALAFVWFLFAPSLAPASVAAGLVSAALIAAATYGVFIEEHEAARHMVFPRLLPALAYPARLVWAMYASSARVLQSVLTGRTAPRLVHFRTRLRSDLARVALATSITFTPGSISVDLDEDHLLVHWLNATTRHSRRAGEELKGGLEAAIGRIWV